VDRVKAIEMALCSADDGDVVVVAGKGHEQTQFVGEQMIAHSDVRCVQSVLLRRGVHV
jgi:UDP-N-acetylmuramoyl-L-alanyl-D-glutamate--2,6-diaminopimelate ligase